MDFDGISVYVSRFIVSSDFWKFETIILCIIGRDKICLFSVD